MRGFVKQDARSPTGLTVELMPPEAAAMLFFNGDVVALKMPGGERIGGRVIRSVTGEPIVVAVPNRRLQPGTELSMATS